MTILTRHSDFELSDSDIEMIARVGMLSAMLKWQHELSIACGVNRFDRQTSIEMALGQLMVEAGEAFAPFLVKTKPWKPQIPDFDKIDEEIIDVLHYVLTYFNLRAFNDTEIIEAYRRKNIINFERIREKMKQLEEAADVHPML
jgi:NTP pyrophosphatase (non-canonical NTP hydrolase)